MMREHPKADHPDDAGGRGIWPTGRFELVFPAEPVELRGLRASMRAWLGERDVRAPTQNALLLAAGEACSNAIEHAYRGRSVGEVTVEIDESPDHMLTVTVRDFGRFRPRSRAEPGRGRGTTLMRKLTMDFSRDSTPLGTTVRFRLPMAADAWK